MPPMDARRWRQVLQETGSRHGPARWHGLLCALALASPPPDAARLAGAVHAWCGGPPPQVGAGLDALVAETVDALRSQALSFILPLPEDEAPLAERLEALREWCRAFLWGVAEAGVEPRFSPLAREWLRDLVEVSRVAVPAAPAAEDDFDFQELVEYVRIGLLTACADVMNDESAEQDRTR